MSVKLAKANAIIRAAFKKAAELGDGCCPECYESQGDRRYDFDEIDSEASGPARYRCEECGVIIESE